MKRLLWLLCLPSVAWGAWSTPGTPTAWVSTQNAAVTPTSPSCSAGSHILVVFASRSQSATWTATGSFTEIADAQGIALYAKVAVGSDTMPTGTPTGAGATDPAMSTAFCASGGETTLGSLLAYSGNQTNGTADATVDTPAVTATAAGALKLWIGVHRDNNFDVATSFPTGSTAFSSNGEYPIATWADATAIMAYAVDSGTNNISASNFTLQVAGAASQSLVVGLAAAAGGAVSITDIDTDESITYSQTNVVITGTGFGASQGAGSVQLRCADSINVTQTSIDSWSDTSIQFDVTQGECQFGDINVRVTNNSAQTDDQPVVFTVPSGEWYINVTDAPDTLVIDANGVPNRLYGTGTDIANGDQIHVKRTGGSGNVTLNSNASFTVDDTVTAIQYRYHAGSTWNTLATWNIYGPAPSWSGPAQADTTLAQSAAMTAVDFASRFAIGEAAKTSYSSHEFGTVSALTTASGSGTNSTSLVPASYTSLAEGNYIKIGSTDPVRIRYVGTASVTLWEARTWSNGATISTVAVNSGTLPTGTSLNTSTGSWSGTPTTVSTSSQDQFVRMTDAFGLTADSNGFGWVIDAPPVPPVLVGVITDQNYAVASGAQTFDVSSYATGESSCALNSGSESLPSGWSFSSCAFSIPTTTAATWTGLIDYTNSGGTVTSAEFQLLVASNPDLTVDPLPAVGGFTITLTTAADYTCYVETVRRTATAPSAAQIRVGTDGNDNLAYDHESVTVPANTPTTVSLTAQFPVQNVYSVCWDGVTYTEVDERTDVERLPKTGLRDIRLN